MNTAISTQRCHNINGILWIADNKASLWEEQKVQILFWWVIFGHYQNKALEDDNKLILTLDLDCRRAEIHLIAQKTIQMFEMRHEISITITSFSKLCPSWPCAMLRWAPVCSKGMHHAKHNMWFGLTSRGMRVWHVCMRQNLKVESNKLLLFWFLFCRRCVVVVYHLPINGRLQFAIIKISCWMMEGQIALIIFTQMFST
jgi:hypothetical protein